MQWQKFVLCVDCGQFQVRLWLSQRLNLGQIEKLQSVFEKSFGGCGFNFTAEMILVKMETNSTFAYQCLISIDQAGKFYLFNGLHVNPIKAIRKSVKRMRASAKDIIDEEGLVCSQAATSVPPFTEETWRKFVEDAKNYKKP